MLLSDLELLNTIPIIQILIYETKLPNLKPQLNFMRPDRDFVNCRIQRRLETVASTDG